MNNNKSLRHLLLLSSSSPFDSVEESKSLNKEVSLAYEVELDKQPQLIVQLGHTTPGNSHLACFSPDGQFVLTGGRTNFILWEAPTGREIRKFQGHEDDITALALSADNKYIASAEKGKEVINAGTENFRVNLWDTFTGQKLKEFNGHTGEIKHLSLSINGSYLLTSSLDGSSFVWETSTGLQVKRFEGGHYFEKGYLGIQQMAFSLNGKYCMTGERNGNVTFWSLGSEIYKNKQNGHRGIVREVSFSLNSRFAMTKGDDNNLVIWDVENCLVIKRFLEHYYWIDNAEFLIDGRYFLLRPSNRILSVYDTHTCKILYQIGNEDYQVNCLAVADLGRLVLVGRTDGIVSIWDVETAKELRQFGPLPGEILSVDVNINGYIAATDKNGNFYLWNGITGEKIRSNAEHVGNIYSIRFSPDGQTLLSEIEGESIKICSVKDGKELHKFFLNDRDYNSPIMSPDGQYICFEVNNFIRFFQTSTGTELFRFKVPKKIIRPVIFSPDSKYLLTIHKEQSYLWEAKTGKEIKKFEFEIGSWDHKVPFTEDGHYFISRGYETTIIYETATGIEVRRFEGECDKRVFLLNDKRHVLSLGDSLELCDIETGNTINGLYDPTEFSEIDKVTISVNGRFIHIITRTWSYNYEHHIYEIDNGKLIPKFSKTKENFVESSLDGNHILKFIYSKKLVLFNLEKGREVLTFSNQEDVSKAEFSPDGKYLLTRDSSGIQRLWCLKATNYSLLKGLKFFRKGKLIFSSEPDERIKLKFSPTGRFVHYEAPHCSHQIVRETFNCYEIYLTENSDDYIEKVYFSPDDRFIVALTGSGVLNVFDTNLSKLVCKYDGYGLSGVSFTPDGNFLLVDFYWHAIILDIQTGRIIQSFEVLKTGVTIDFSPDGSQIITKYAKEPLKSSATFGLYNTNPEKQNSKFDFPYAEQIAYLSDGTVVSFNTTEKSICFWDHLTGALVKKLEGIESLDSGILSLLPSFDGKYILIYKWNGQIILYSTELNTILGEILDDNILTGGAKISSDGCYYLDSGNNLSTEVSLIDIATRNEIRRFKGYASAIDKVKFSVRDGIIIAREENGNISLWDINKGQLAELDHKFYPDGQFFNISENGTTAIIKFNEDTLALFDLTTKQIIQEIGKLDIHNPVILSPDGSLIAKRDDSRNLQIIKSKTGEEISVLNVIMNEQPHGYYGRFSPFSPNFIVFSPDNKYIFTGGMFGSYQVFDIEKKERVSYYQIYAEGMDSSDARDKQVEKIISSPNNWHHLAQISGFDVNDRVMTTSTSLSSYQLSGFSGRLNDLHFSPDGRFITAGCSDQRAYLWDGNTGDLLVSFSGHSKKVNAVALSTNQDLLLTGSDDKTARLYKTNNGKYIQSFIGHADGITSVSFLNGEKHVLTASKDGTMRIWRVSDGTELCRLVSYNGGTWVVIDTDGRFDTNNLETIKGLFWIMPDKPLSPLSLDIFMRDYYEPGLLPRILNDEKFNPIRPLNELNILQPLVRIIDVNEHSNLPGQVSVEIEVENVFETKIQSLNRESGVFDLRLFRDGQLVGYAPENGGKIEVDGETNKAILSFNVNLPNQLHSKQIEFSAYAFNSDRVKSDTFKHIFKTSKTITPERGHAYVITIGVNSYDNPVYNLKYAVNDALQIQRIMSNCLNNLSKFDEIIEVCLLSLDEERNGKKTIIRDATKNKIHQVLNFLSGKNSQKEELNKTETIFQKILKARPDDLIILSFSCHGFVDANGTFYLFTDDSPKNPELGTLEIDLTHCISSDELSSWLRDIDAGEIVIILDTCYSAAAIEGKEFKPGPMGNRGLGQLAYDKGIRILTASQSAEVAIESDNIKQGLLTYALIEEGLKQGKADYKPKDGEIWLSELLEYAAERVPSLYEEIYSGKLKSIGRSSIMDEASSADQNYLLKIRSYQKPSLFDFARKRTDILLSKNKL